MTSTAWQPIADHPKLGHACSRVLVYGKDTGVQPGHVYYYADGSPPRGVAEGFHGDWEITHWMPLPDPPEAS